MAALACTSSSSQREVLPEQHLPRPRPSSSTSGPDVPGSGRSCVATVFPHVGGRGRRAAGLAPRALPGRASQLQPQIGIALAQPGQHLVEVTLYRLAAGAAGTLSETAQP